MQLRGFDISSWSHGHDGKIDFAKAKAAGMGFVMIKATQGLHYKNPYLAEDAVEAHHHGLLVGTYHYADPNHDDAVLQAKYAAAAVTGLPLSLGVALDLEEQGSVEMHALGQWAQDFMRTMNEAHHQCPLYIDGDFLGRLPGAPWGHKLWYASTQLPEYGGPFKIWMQQTDMNSHLDGVPGPIDHDTFFGVRGSNPPAGPVRSSPASTAGTQTPPKAPTGAKTPATA